MGLVCKHHIEEPYYNYYYYFEVRCARPGESEDTLLVQRPQPHTTNPWKEEKSKTVGDKKERGLKICTCY